MQKKKKKKVAKVKTKTTKTAQLNKPIVKKTAKKLAHAKVEGESASKNRPVELMNHSSDSSAKKNMAELSDEQIENYKKWLKFQKQFADQKPENYQMRLDFEIKTPLQHKVHGWGVVVQKRDNYIDVLFESGMKTLVVNYKP